MRTNIPIFLALTAALLFAPATGKAETATPDPLMGLWASEIHFGPTLRGPLTITRNGGSWHAAIGAAEAVAPVRGAEMRFAFLGGEFRGKLGHDGRAIHGFWMRPSGKLKDRQDPGGAGNSFASPVELRRDKGGEWRGIVRPLDDNFTVYLKIFRNQVGILTGAFRNPQINANGGASQFSVTRDRDALHFNVRYEGGEINHDAIFLHAPDRIRIPWPAAGRTLDLIRRTPSEAAAFFPRPPDSPLYTYRRPPETADGWRTARAGDVGLDEAALIQAVRKIAESDPTARPPVLMHSLLVAHRGKLVLEEYFFGYDRDTPHDTRSGGKTYASVLLGAAMRKGGAIGPDSKIYTLLADRGPFANPDPRKKRITLAHLMTHNSGLACDDNDDASPGNEEKLWAQDAQPDFWKYTLDLPMAFDPGTHYAYCSANMNLMGGALTVATGTWLPEQFEREVAVPLQFGPWHWILAPNGEGYLGGGAFLRPRDYLKIGQAYLSGGVWNGRRIVDAAWVERSTAPWAEISPATTGLDAEAFGNSYGGVRKDGLAWHLDSLSSGGRSYKTYGASGNGGQMVIVVPEADLAVAFTGGNYSQGMVWTRWPQQIIGDLIIPALKLSDRTPSPTP
jgi:CubicO group peptidase (beta-lactamase class C family)